MDAIELIKSRRSVRKYKSVKVDRDLMLEIIEIARYAPSWANYQVARYTLVDDQKTIQALADSGVNGFIYNVDTLKNATGVAVLSFVKGKSGSLDKYDLSSEENSNMWEVFDAGIACQTFCLAAHAKEIGTCIMGVIDKKSIAKIVNLPDDETVAALIVYGYPEGESSMKSRKDVSDIVRFID